MPVKTIDYQKLYHITDMITPLEDDCGKLCGKICCRPDQNNTLGVYLYPGEEDMFTREEDWLCWEQRNPAEDDFPASWSNPVYFIRCAKPCPRKHRPLNCRFFPLAPHLLKDNTLLLIHETLPLPYQCPLIKRKIPLRKEFVDTVVRCWQELLTDQRVRDLVQMDSREREKERKPPFIVRAILPQ